MGFLSFIPAWAWRWIAIAGIGASLYGTGWLQGRHHEEIKFDDYKEQVKLAGDKQAFLTAQTIKAHQTLKELSDAEAKTAAAERDAATLRVRQLVQAGRDSRIVPAPGGAATGSNHVCFAADVLDRGIRTALDRATERTLAIAQEGQRGVDIAMTCRNWTTSLGGTK